MQLITLATALLASSVSLATAHEGHHGNQGHKPHHGNQGHKPHHGNPGHGAHPITTTKVTSAFHWSNSSTAEVPTTFKSSTEVTITFVPTTSEAPSTSSASPSPSTTSIDFRIPLYGQCYKEGSYYPYKCIDGAHCRVDSYWYGQCTFDGELYNQCGGINYKGKEACATGLTCSSLNDYYHQCLIPTTYAYTYM
ncbi:unnamed protein product [[Candida] boidinii]|uniref:Unnamed protein product n=1 Tax=Candida boidinii TaxID=5477 RepID=A0ACB5THM8_CANBO|nr:unnamed protein product [[Candida] boidinii]